MVHFKWKLFYIFATASFAETLENSLCTDTGSVFVIPYLLFTGILMKGLEKEISHITKTTEKKYILCNYLGYHPKIEGILQERIKELLEN